MPQSLPAAPPEAVDRALVTVTFLRMARPAVPPPAPRFPPDFTCGREALDLGAYRRLYDAVGRPWLWWLRRIMPDAALARHLADPAVSIFVLRQAGQLAGFFELEAAHLPEVNLNYFGLAPEMIGHGLGKPLLAAAIARAFASPAARVMTVNTCTADHPNALPNYLAAGFQQVRRLHETWDIPRRLGLQVPAHLAG